ncbi:cytochrome c [Polynucleobacter sp. SHI8]|uniref:c-type cytochrome n=1 Tax=unclassified Polynucleobacter TaxID=2640945 RepID=UPI0024928AAE|nr:MULTISPECIES: cytochrome c [unclassified Polynucleobacter]BDW10318.1 cytochrome c [Polynucleobacter sp. SHI2]BDW12764.1 cytochrome c [Polynucleobacter sp. SHI8]
MNKSFKIALVAIFTTVIAGTALAQFARPDAAIKYRKATFTVMSTHFARIGAVAKGEVPFNKEEVAKNAAIVNAMASLPWQAFGPGTEGGDALPSVWSDEAKFKSAQEKLIAATASLSSAGDLDAVKKATANVGAACKNCHDDFKKK